MKPEQGETVNSKNYYDLLGVDRKATAEDIKSAFRSLTDEYSIEFDPETGDIRDIKSEFIDEKLQVLSNAYKTLISEKSRAQYDLNLTSQLSDWGEAKSPEEEKRFEEKRIKSGGTPYAFGTFGSVRQAAGSKNEFNSPECRPLSEVLSIHKRKGPIGWLKWLLTGK